MQKGNLKNETPTDANNVLSAGFRSVREAKRFSKMYSLMMIYQNGQIDCDINLDAAMLVTDYNRDWAYKELLKMGIPNGFQYIGSFDDALRWFFKSCR
jgi:hypothetical protein